MAKQHFYSRVPAKMSLFNKMVGYDTFAHSEGLTREFIETELSAVYDNAPIKEDAEAIRAGILPDAYCQFVSADGKLVQSAVKYLAQDYTGERSSYMTHSLVLSDSEKSAHLGDYKKAPFDPSPFTTDITAFDLTSFDSVPITDYPEVEIPAAQAAPADLITEKYDTGMLKRLIYSLLSVCSGKSKAVFLELHSNVATLSRDSLDFLNAVFAIFPYNMRETMSFVTYAGDVTKFTSFKIRCLPDRSADIPQSKGITIKMAAKDYVGVTDENVAANAQIVDFFYSLLKNDEMRYEFLAFYDNAVSVIPGLAKTSFKTVGDIVTLFKVLCPYYEGSAVITDDDAVLDFVTIYEKLRTAVKDEYRENALDCLKRYPLTHTAIPKNVFSKVTKIYPTETAQSKKGIMATVLDLIHTDAMREKLFAFIKDNYENEDEDSRRVIMDNVFRVYYGGFLQTQILDFADARFDTEPAETRMNMVERLLLTIRTPSVQDKVVKFIRNHYAGFTEEEKEKFYITFFEMIPEGDKLSRILAETVDDIVEPEREEYVAEGLLSIVEADERKSDPKVCTVLTGKCGFCERTVAKKVFGDWSKRKIVDTFISAVCKKDFIPRLETVSEIWHACPEMNSTVSDKLLTSVEQSLKSAKVTVFAALDGIEILDKLKTEVRESAAFVDKLINSSLKSLAQSTIPTVFDLKRFPDGIASLTERAKTHKFILSASEYEPVKAYTEAAEAAARGDGKAIFEAAARINGDARTGAANLLKSQKNEMDTSCALMFALAVEYLKSGEIRLTESVSSMSTAFGTEARKGYDGDDAQTISRLTDECALTYVMTASETLVGADIPTELKDSLTSPDGVLAKYVAGYVKKYDKKAKKYLTEKIASTPADSPFCDILKNALSVKPESGGFFKRLFRK